MLKGKLYAVIGADGIEISRTNGIKLLLNGDGNLNVEDEVQEKIINEICYDPDGFVDFGLDVVVEINPDGMVAERIVALGDENKFDNGFDNDDDDADGTENIEDFDVEE